MSSLIIPSVMIGGLESVLASKEIIPPYPEWFGNRYTHVLETQDHHDLTMEVFVQDKAYEVLQNSKTRVPFVCDIEIVPFRNLIDCDVKDFPRKANVRRSVLSQRSKDLCSPETIFTLVRDHYATIQFITPSLYLAMSPLSYNREGHFIFVLRGDKFIDAVSSVVQKEDVRYSYWVFARNKRPIE